MIRYEVSSILISVPPYLEMRTLSPAFTVNSIFLPSSSRLPVPRATTSPSWGFSLAVSGMMIPPFLVSPASRGFTSTRSPSGRTLTLAMVGFARLVGWFYCVWCYLRGRLGWRKLGEEIPTQVSPGDLGKSVLLKPSALLLFLLIHDLELRVDRVA